MIPRRLLSTLMSALAEVPAVALLGPRQAGKTTLAHEVAGTRPTVYLDLESEADRAKLSEPELYLAQHADKLVILDEIQRTPQLFRSLRGLIDKGRRSGHGTGRFLVLGSASIDLLRQSSESLAGRIRYLELGPLDAGEVGQERLDVLWLRGGFPESLLAGTDAASLRWRTDFIRTYLERDIPQLGPRIPAETLRRLWTMLAHQQGGLLNAAALARALAVDGKTVAAYLDLLVDLLLVRRLTPWHGNVRKRLVKSPKVYIRDSGLVHALLGIADREALLAHPAVGGSWEGLAIESLIAAAPNGAEPHFFRTAAGAEIDLLLKLPGHRKPWAIEIKRGLAPKLERGFRVACEAVRPERRLVVYGGVERFPLAEDVETVPLIEMCEELSAA
ncbi:MAG: ATP-binding protein [Acidobacteria bacterium]|nr:ATP-binding protein [Thermoanaerobaculia bacterium]MDI9631241.1 ATP-binding protein [Acidobacteriota bacterium]MBP7812460.1 ATP-binding protein [Thermoanaerobaculia bacterium]NLN12506.1 ATP-binding protein [Acidobacteriota bacterium]HPA95285.1 ATP-binding protein [Thermoanaerobaculia bacterium]